MDIVTMNAIVEKIRVPTDLENMGRLNPFHWGRGGGGGGGGALQSLMLG